MSESEAMLWLTFGLLVFAGVQVWIQHRSEMTRTAERKSDLDTATDVTWQIAYAEHFRLNALAERWERHDLVLLSAIGVLNARDVLPRDWGTVTRSLAGLGPEAGMLGALAVTLSHDVAADVATLNSVVQSYASQMPAHSSPDVVVKEVRSTRGEALDKIVSSIRGNLREIAFALGDAVLLSPRAHVERDFVFRDDMKSRIGKEAAKRLLEKQSSR